MRILVSSVVDLRRSAHSRLHEFVHRLAYRHKIVVLSIKDWWKAEQTDVKKYEHGVVGGSEKIQIHYFTQKRISPIVQELTSIMSLPGLLKQLGRGFDVHLNYNTLVSGLFVALIMRRLGVPTAYDLADDLAAMIGISPQISPVLRPLGAAVAKLMIKWNIACAARVTATTDVLAIPTSSQEKVEILPNGVDTQVFKRRDVRGLRSALNLQDEFVLGYVGVLREWVDMEPVFSSLAELLRRGWNLRFLVIGEEGGLGANRLLARKYGVVDQVLFVGTVPYEEVPKYVSLMDVGFIPFGDNPVAMGALPLKLLEYMACEVAVVCTPLPGIVNAVGDRVFYARNQEEVIQCLERVKQNPEEVRGNQVEGRVFVQQNFEWGNIIDRLEDLLYLVAERASIRHTPRISSIGKPKC